jgi:hypothetical protein
VFFKRLRLIRAARSAGLVNRIAAFFKIITKGLIYMQIRESGKWIELVRTAYRPAELVVLPDGGKAYRAGGVQEKRRSRGRRPVDAGGGLRHLARMAAVAV